MTIESTSHHHAGEAFTAMLFGLSIESLSLERGARLIDNRPDHMLGGEPWAAASIVIAIYAGYAAEAHYEALRDNASEGDARVNLDEAQADRTAEELLIQMFGDDDNYKEKYRSSAYTTAVTLVFSCWQHITHLAQALESGDQLTDREIRSEFGQLMVSVSDITLH